MKRLTVVLLVLAGAAWAQGPVGPGQGTEPATIQEHLDVLAKWKRLKRSDQKHTGVQKLVIAAIRGAGGSGNAQTVPILLDFLKTGGKVKACDVAAVEELGKLLMKLHMKPLDLIRTQEAYYKKELKGLNLNDEEWTREMVENPKLIRRPIVEGKYKAVVGDPVENIDNL